jgi:hypothetical protein
MRRSYRQDRTEKQQPSLSHEIGGTGVTVRAMTAENNRIPAEHLRHDPEPAPPRPALVTALGDPPPRPRPRKTLHVVVQGVRIEGYAYTEGRRQVFLFPIKALAQVLRRSTGTLRDWERDGKLPIAPRTLPIAPGTFSDSRRLYTLEYIRAVAGVAHDCGLLHDDVPRRRLLRDFARLAQQAIDELGQHG